MDADDDHGPFSPRYLIVSALRITGPVDPGVLRGALDNVVARHELLRTVVVRNADPAYQADTGYQADTACQVVYPPCRVPLEVRDLPVARACRDTVIQELMREAHSGTISAREVPLLRALLCRFDDRDSALFLTVHHSVSDGWSVQVILRDLGALYEARRTGTPAKLPAVRQYREYAEWQRASTASTIDTAGTPRTRHRRHHRHRKRSLHRKRR